MGAEQLPEYLDNATRVHVARSQKKSPAPERGRGEGSTPTALTRGWWASCEGVGPLARAAGPGDYLDRLRGGVRVTDSFEGAFEPCRELLGGELDALALLDDALHLRA